MKESSSWFVAQGTVQVQVLIHYYPNNNSVYKSVAMGFKTSSQQKRHQLHDQRLNVSKQFGTFGAFLTLFMVIENTVYAICCFPEVSQYVSH